MSPFLSVGISPMFDGRAKTTTGPEIYDNAVTPEPSRSHDLINTERGKSDVRG